jgi:CRISPR/Cas system CSM-associated protein Csm2 small subunit
MDPRHDAQLKEPRRDLQPTYHFTINCLLYSRIETGLVSNPDAYDEDVDAYLAHLLHAFISPGYVEQSKRFLSRYDVDVFRRFAHASDARVRYVIHKTNADFLLVSTGIFDNPGPPPSPRAHVQPSEEAYVGRGKTYYHFAYTYSRQMHRRNEGVAEVLEKLSVAFDRYLKILSHMRGEPLDLSKRLAQGEVYHLERTANEAAMQQLLRTKQDELLELYTAWKARPDAETVESLERLVSEIRQLNPDFHFELPKRA